MKDIIQQTVAMANYRPIGRSNTASSDSDPEAGPPQSLSSAVDSHGTGPDQQQEIEIEIQSDQHRYSMTTTSSPVLSSRIESMSFDREPFTTIWNLLYEL